MPISFFKVKKKKTKRLYQGYLQSLEEKAAKEDEEKKILLEQALKETSFVTDGISTRNPKVKEEKIKKEKPEKKSQSEVNVTLTVAVVGLDYNCGCSYIVDAIAYYIKNELNRSVCIVNLSGRNADYKSNIALYFTVDNCNLYDKYKYVIFDIGNINENRVEKMKEFKRSNKKVVLAKNEKGSFNQIYNFIEEDKKAVKKWVFLFNYVAEGLQKQVFDLMEDYECYCLKLFNNQNQDKESKSIIQSIIKL